MHESSEESEFPDRARNCEHLSEIHYFTAREDGEQGSPWRTFCWLFPLSLSSCQVGF